MSLPTTTSDAKSLIEEVNAQVIASLHLTPKDLPMYKQSTSIRFDHPDHFASDAIIMARQLLGARMVRVLPNGTRLSGKIVECECYLGVDDAAAHSFQGKRSAKNESMYRAGGVSYIYQIYGMYFCCNIICGKAEHPTGVLIRGLEPIEGKEEMLKGRLAGRKKKGTMMNSGAAADDDNDDVIITLTEAEKRRHDSMLCSGPGRLCQAMFLDKSFNGVDLINSNELYLERGEHVEAHDIVVSPRIGVDYAGIWAKAPLRFSIRENTYVSKPWPWPTETTVKKAMGVVTTSSSNKEKRKGHGKRDAETIETTTTLIQEVTTPPPTTRRTRITMSKR